MDCTRIAWDWIAVDCTINHTYVMLNMNATIFGSAYRCNPAFTECALLSHLSLSIYLSLTQAQRQRVRKRARERDWETLNFFHIYEFSPMRVRECTRYREAQIISNLFAFSQWICCLCAVYMWYEHSNTSANYVLDTHLHICSLCMRFL